MFSGFGEPMLDLINYMENNHIHHCVPSNVSSGLQSLPLDFIYYNGKRTNERTTKKLPTGERLNGRKSYKRILSYFTTTDISGRELMKKGKEQQSLFYEQVNYKNSLYMKVMISIPDMVLQKTLIVLK